jgi:hypothetical protein
MTLAFTLERLMTEQVVIERAKRTYDGGGAQTKPQWQTHVTVACRLWWDRSTGVRSGQREFVSPQRTADLSVGGLIIPLGTDVKRTDRITDIQQLNPETGEWVTYISGNIEISGVLNQEDHIELELVRTNIGA